MTTQTLISGFGGQGVLFAGKFLAFKGLVEDKEVSWLPSYGPEMRGGTASCGVILSDEPVGSPIVSNPDVLIAMNLPSLDRYENDTVSGGSIFVDSTLVSRKVNRDDVKAFYIPATQMAIDAGVPTLANMILIGKMIKETGIFSFDDMIDTVKKLVPAKKQELVEKNMLALEAGYNYKD
ncbi:MAG: 2-oxoacid:ferredoxin oxidoreductase subunit gamma [Clostridiales bacterium]|nr:2-oxoacid:ferredoxin oxidoreductase subunit gamma [Clostridiales bacterium]